MRDEVIEGITQQVAAVEQALPAARIREIVDASFAKLPPAARLLALLEHSPELLTAGSPQTPPALEKLIIRLRAEGADTLTQPRCVLCGQARVLRRVMPDGRACDNCSRNLETVVGPCHRCQKTVRLQAAPDGADYCKGCFAGMRAEAPERIAAATQAHCGIAIPVIRAAVNALPTVRNRRVRLMLELETHGASWFPDPAAGSTLFAHFYDLLREHGAPLPERTCGHCPSTRVLTERLAGRISCRRCYRIGHHNTCDACGDHTYLERVLADGRRLCQRCTNKLPEENAKCTRCGNYRLIAFRSKGGPVCSTCRSAAHLDDCTVCGTRAPCRFPDTDKAICQQCAAMAQMDTCTICGNHRRCRWAGTTRAACDQCSNRREPCMNCGAIRLRHKRSGNGFLCWACTPPIIETCTSCNIDRIVNGRVDGLPFCPTCYPKQPESFRPCTNCGLVDRLIHKRCPRCRADQMIRKMIPDELAATDPGIARLRAGCFNGPPRKIIYAFERGTLACTLLGRLLRDPALRTHTFLDTAGNEQQTRPVRSLLIDHGLLPPRDELLARFEAWVAATMATIPDPSERAVITQFARWRHLRGLRQQHGPLSVRQLSWRRYEIATAISLVAWAHRRGQSLATLTQHDIDRWLARPHGSVHYFLAWTTRHGHTAPLEAPRPVSGGRNPQRINDEERWRLLADVIEDTSIDPHTKLAAGLMLLYGLRAAQIVKLRPDDITDTGGAVLVALGSDPLALPVELAQTAAIAAQNRAAPRMFIQGVDTQWLYPGPRAGHHLTGGTLNARLRKLGIEPRLARTSALVALSQELVPAVLSRLTGLDVSSCVAWRDAVGASTTAYAATAALKGIPLPQLTP